MIKQQILRFKVTMHNPELVQVLNASYYLVEEPASLSLLYPLILNNEVEELPATSIFHDEVELLGRLNNLVELDYMRMPD